MLSRYLQMLFLSYFPNFLTKSMQCLIKILKPQNNTTWQGRGAFITVIIKSYHRLSLTEKETKVYIGCNMWKTCQINHGEMENWAWLAIFRCTEAFHGAVVKSRSPRFYPSPPPHFYPRLCHVALSQLPWLEVLVAHL